MTSREDLRILGWAFGLFALPMIYAARIQEALMNQLDEWKHPEPAHEWEAFRWCNCKAEDTEHLFIEWRDEPIVTIECLECGVTSVIEDLDPDA
ncbi:MAG: hypothetical protein JWN22_1256 [Nocardioides sp.]|nr:hypothetical protein [Nocardioides sp.]